MVGNQMKPFGYHGKFSFSAGVQYIRLVSFGQSLARSSTKTTLKINNDQDYGGFFWLKGTKMSPKWTFLVEIWQDHLENDFEDNDGDFGCRKFFIGHYCAGKHINVCLFLQYSDKVNHRCKLAMLKLKEMKNNGQIISGYIEYPANNS